MNASWKGRLSLAVVAGMVAVALVVLVRWQPARAARPEGPVTAPRYTVVMTEGHTGCHP